MRQCKLCNCGSFQYTYLLNIICGPIYLAYPALLHFHLHCILFPSSTTWRINCTQAEGTPRSLSVMACGIFLIFLTWSHFLQCCDSEKLLFSLYINLLACSVCRIKSFSSLEWFSLSFLFTLYLPFTHLQSVNFPGIKNEHTDAFNVH